MNSETGPMLETDRLDDLLEEPAPAPPVVVVQYRNRGVPSWVFFPLIFVVPLAAIVVYHRMVVERYRVQAAQANSLLVQEIKIDRSKEPLIRSEAPSTAVLPGAATEPAASPSATDPFKLLADSQTAPPMSVEPPGGDSSSPATTAPAPENAVVGATASVQPASTPAAAPVVIPAATPAAAPTAPEKPVKITMRSVLPNPFADGNDSPRPPTPAAGAGPELGAVANTPAPSEPPSQDRPVVQPPAVAAEKPAAAGAAPAVAPVSGVGALAMAPLPSKEESLRQIAEEAAQRRAEIVEKSASKIAETRSQRVADQIKFRDELRELLRTQGNKAGADIDALVKRAGHDFDPETFARANHIWRRTRKTQPEKVKAVRALELPESVILDFLSDDIYPKLMARDGLRSSGEVRVLAATQLLKYAFPVPGASTRQPAAGAGEVNPAARRQSPSRKTVVSTPR